MTQATPLIIGVAGGTGSGKTTVARKLSSALPPSASAIIDHDAYYRDRSALSESRRRRRRAALRAVARAQLRNVDVAELVTVIRIRVLRLLARRGVIDDAEPLTLLPTDLAEREPVLAELAMAAVSGLAPAGPERRERPPLRLGHYPGASLTGPLCATGSPVSGCPCPRLHQLESLAE